MWKIEKGGLILSLAGISVCGALIIDAVGDFRGIECLSGYKASQVIRLSFNVLWYFVMCLFLSCSGIVAGDAPGFRRACQALIGKRYKEGDGISDASQYGHHGGVPYNGRGNDDGLNLSVSIIRMLLSLISISISVGVMMYLLPRFIKMTSWSGYLELHNEALGRCGLL